MINQESRIKQLVLKELEKYRTQKKTVRALANKMGVSSATIYNCINDDVKKNDDTIKKVAAYFGVTPAYLRGETDDKEISKPSQSLEPVLELFLSYATSKREKLNKVEQLLLDQSIAAIKVLLQ